MLFSLQSAKTSLSSKAVVYGLQTPAHPFAQNSIHKAPTLPPASQFDYESTYQSFYSLKNSKGVVFVYSCQIYNIHPINRCKIRTVIALKHLFRQSYHFLHWDVESVAYPFE